MNLSSKYKPLYLSELELEYPKLIEYLNLNKTFIINGPKYCGKSTIIKLYLKVLNYDYLLIDDFNLPKEYIIEKIKYKTNSVFSYFYDKKYIIIIDNFELFDLSIKEFIINTSKNIQYCIITNKYLNTNINYLRINSYSNDYLLNLYCTIYFLEKNKNCDYLPEINNISNMFCQLEFNLNTEIDYEKNDHFKLFFDKFDYKLNDLVSEKNFIKKLNILDKIKSYSVFQYNLIYNYKSIHNLADCYENLSCSKIFLYNNNNSSYINSYNLEYYSILSIIGSSIKLNDFKIYKENFQFRKKKNLNYYK